VTYLGYPSTTAIPNFGWRFVDAITDPPGAEDSATERLVRLDKSFLCYRPPADAPEPSQGPAASGQPITFGSFNAPMKIGTGTLDAWARVLREVPGSRLLLKGRPFGDAGVRRRVQDELAGRGIDAQRIEFALWTPTIRDHLACYSRVDVALDTFPYNGTTTTCEALWMGVPVVTLEGRMHAGRVGASLLTAVGKPELIARTTDEYVALAARLARDPGRLASLRFSLREKMATSPLRDETGHAARFEAALRSAWREWCESGS
jgi:predicted O-linked N-acetylglucosamine transferase (SPINDLY family)